MSERPPSPPPRRTCRTSGCDNDPYPATKDWGTWCREHADDPPELRSGVTHAERALAASSSDAAAPLLRSIGAERIAAERIRQFTAERYNRFHDGGRAGELAAAGAAYATDDRHLWPWSPDAWKPTPTDPVRQLVKAGALIAAAIDSLLREEVRPAAAAPPSDAAHVHRGEWCALCLGHGAALVSKAVSPSDAAAPKCPECGASRRESDTGLGITLGPGWHRESCVGLPTWITPAPSDPAALRECHAGCDLCGTLNEMDASDAAPLREALHDEFCADLCGHDTAEEYANPTHRADEWWNGRAARLRAAGVRGPDDAAPTTTPEDWDSNAGYVSPLAALRPADVLMFVPEYRPDEHGLRPDAARRIRAALAAAPALTSSKRQCKYPDAHAMHGPTCITATPAPEEADRG